VRVELQSKVPGEEMESRTVALDVDGHTGPLGAPAYERLLGDVIEGDARLFARQDTVEESWRVVEPLLEGAPPVVPYEPGTWGPDAASQLLPDDDDWMPCAEGLPAPRHA
jgi:glucose-6-phosphate 1-dehydrogenase